MLYTKNGSIPKPETDGTEGWLEVPMPPESPEGKEVVWLNWEWVVRDPKPVDRTGYQWNWNHDQMAWVELPLAGELPVEPLPTEPIPALSSADVIALTSEQISSL